MAERLLLALNAGSSSLKFAVFSADPAGRLESLARGEFEELEHGATFTATVPPAAPTRRAWAEGERLGHDGALAFLFDWLAERFPPSGARLSAVGHRVVHGGLRYTAPVRVDADVVAALEALTPLAPLHQPHSLRPMRLILGRLPELAQVACFDTAFHATQPEVARTFALPLDITDRGVRRYGFHGLSYEYVVSTLSRLDPRAAAGRTVVCHLGNGSSMCAVAAGRSVATTMGFTPVDGLPMGTRSGTLDPGVMLYLMDEMGMDARALEALIYHRSGLLGVSGISSDMRVLLASESPRAAFAVALYVYRIGRELGSLAAALGGLDALVFTGGIGEHSVVVRERVCRDARWLGLELDADANARGASCISRAGSRIAAWVIPTDEELVVARHTDALTGGG